MAGYLKYWVLNLNLTCFIISLQNVNVDCHNHYKDLQIGKFKISKMHPSNQNKTFEMTM